MKKIVAKMTIELYEDGSMGVTRAGVGVDNMAEFQYALDEMGEAVGGPFYERKGRE